MTEPRATSLRRRDDRLIGDSNTRLSLLEQRNRLADEAHERRYGAIERAITDLSSQIDTALGTMASQSSELSASPAGRRVLGELATLRDAVKAHNEFIQQMTGGLRLARFALGTSFLSVMANVVMWLAIAGR